MIRFARPARGVNPIAMIRAQRGGGGRTAPALAGRLGARFVMISGNHFPYILDPGRFVAELRPQLTAMPARHE
jgi:hypothetical protein